jgi:hypothetical protein
MDVSVDRLWRGDVRTSSRPCLDSHQCVRRVRRNRAILSRERNMTVKVAVYVRLDAESGKEAEVEKFLKGGLAPVEREPATTVSQSRGISAAGVGGASPSRLTHGRCNDSASPRHEGSLS